MSFHRDSGVSPANHPTASATEEPATAIEAAAALIELALHESLAPVEDLSNALGRMAQALSPPSSGAPVASSIPHDMFAREISICVQALQFHDRLTQQLTQVRNLLASIASNALPTDTAGRPLTEDSQSWSALLDNLRARFTSESHRTLFNLLLPEAGERLSAPSLHANEGSVELF